MNETTRLLLIARMQEFISLTRPDQKAAGDFEGDIRDLFPEADDDPWLEDLMFKLACYNPRGGEYLYDTDALLAECKLVVNLLLTA